MPAPACRDAVPTTTAPGRSPSSSSRDRDGERRDGSTGGHSLNANTGPTSHRGYVTNSVLARLAPGQTAVQPDQNAGGG